MGRRSGAAEVLLQTRPHRRRDPLLTCRVGGQSSLRRIGQEHRLDEHPRHLTRAVGPTRPPWVVGVWFCHSRAPHSEHTHRIPNTTNPPPRPATTPRCHAPPQPPSTTTVSDHAWYHPAVPGIDEHCLPRIRSAWAETHARA